MQEKIESQIININWINSLKSKILNLDAITAKTEKNIIEIYETQEKLVKHLKTMLTKYWLQEDSEFKELQRNIVKKMKIMKELNNEQKHYVAISKKDINASISFIRSFYDKTTKDPLTKLWNEEFINNLLEILWDEKKEFNLIYFDLNNLKKTNDTYWHDVGDMLIKKFAELLKLIFWEEKNFVARLHGDEFCVISLDNETEIKYKIWKLLKWLENTKLEVINETTNKKEKIYLSTAYWHAKSKEWKNIQDLIRKADRRMYENKLKTK